MPFTRSRAEVCRYIEHQFEDNKKTRTHPDRLWHYGYTELRELLDYIYDGTPEDARDSLNKY